MRELLRQFIGKTLRIYTVSGVESYLAMVTEVQDEFVILTDFFRKDTMYLAIQYIESFKEEAGKVAKP